jgi:hypothetical protein
MSAHTAAESLILEFVKSPQFHEGLREFMEAGTVRNDNLLGILRQYVTSPLCEGVHRDFWNAPALSGPEAQFDNVDTDSSSNASNNT